MQKLTLILSLTAILLAVSLWVYQLTSSSRTTTAETGNTIAVGETEKTESYQPRLEEDPPLPDPPEAAVRDFDTFINRLRAASEGSALVLHRDALERAEQVFRDTAGVRDGFRIELHSPFFTVDPEAIFALYADLPTLERGLGLFQQHCSQCHGPYGRGNGGSTQGWYAGNYPRNFWYGRFKSRSSEYGTVPTDSDLFRTLTRGMYGSTMPPFRHLSERDRWALVQFVKTLANYYDDYDEFVVNRFDPEEGFERKMLEFGDEPPVNLASVTRGRILFLEQGCAKCHQGEKPTPIGLARWEGGFNWNDEMNRPIQHSRDLTTNVFLAGAAPQDLFRIISGGPNIGPMPNYRNILREDRWALVHYIQSVFKPDFPQAPASADAQANLPPKADSGEEPES